MYCIIYIRNKNISRKFEQFMYICDKHLKHLFVICQKKANCRRIGDKLCYCTVYFYKTYLTVIAGKIYVHSTKKPVTTMLTYPWKSTVLHCNHLGNTWKPLVLMTRHFDYCPSASEGDNQSVRSSAPVVSRCFPGGYNVKLYISRGRLAWWLLAFLHSGC